jgi:hypothetical protein
VSRRPPLMVILSVLYLLALLGAGFYFIFLDK